jgi:hypothetical protein
MLHSAKLPTGRRVLRRWKAAIASLAVTVKVSIAFAFVYVLYTSSTWIDQVEVVIRCSACWPCSDGFLDQVPVVNEGGAIQISPPPSSPPSSRARRKLWIEEEYCPMHQANWWAEPWRWCVHVRAARPNLRVKSKSCQYVSASTSYGAIWGLV